MGGAHSQPFFYKTINGNNFVLLRSKDKSFIDGYKKQQILYPFLQKQNLPVRTASKLDILEYGNEVYVIMERFFGHGHNPEKFAKATKEQQTKFVVQVAVFFYKLHSIPIEILLKELDYTPYFKYDRNISKNKEVFYTQILIILTFWLTMTIIYILFLIGILPVSAHL